VATETHVTGSPVAADGAGHAPVGDEESGSVQSEVEMPTLNIYVTIGLLVVITVVCGQFPFMTLVFSNITFLTQLVAVTAEWLVDSIQGLVDKGTVSTEFVGIILLPIVGNAAGRLFDTLHTFSTHTKLRTRHRRYRLCQRQVELELERRCWIQSCKLPAFLSLGMLFDLFVAANCSVCDTVSWEATFIRLGTDCPSQLHCHPWLDNG
jgi:hypothetical protein